MKRNSRIIAVVVILSFVLAVVAFVLNQDTQPGPEDSHLRVGMAGFGEFNTLSPTRAMTSAPITVVWLLYDRLVDIAPDGSVAPMLAESWESDASLQEWRFSLCSDAIFQSDENGQKTRPVTVEDARASIERAIRIPGYGQTLFGDLVVGAQKFIDGDAERVTGLKVEGKDLIFSLSRPFAFLPESLAVSFLSIVPADTPDETEEPPVGSGPYRLVSWDREAQKIVLAANNAYWGEVSDARPEKLTFHGFENVATAIEEYSSGSIDWLETTSAAIPLLHTAKLDARTEVEKPTSTRIRLVALNKAEGPFVEHPELGEALNWATNRQAIADALGGGLPVGGPIPSTASSSVQKETTYDPSLAKKLIADLPPSALKLEMIVEPGQEPRIIAEILREQWTEVGVEVELKQGLADFWERLVQGNYQMALAYYGPFVPTAEQYLWPYRKEAHPAPNVMRYTSNQFQDAYRKYVSTYDAQQQDVELDRAVQILLRDAPAVWLIHPPFIALHAKDLSVPRTALIPLFNRMQVGE